MASQDGKILVLKTDDNEITLKSSSNEGAPEVGGGADPPGPAP